MLCLAVLATGLSGCLGGAEDPTAPSTSDEPLAAGANPNVTRTLVVAEEGTLPAGAHVEGATVPTGQWDRWFELTIDGVVTGATLTMTWEPTNPSMERLLLGFGPREGSGANAHAGSGAVSVTGTSPLTLTVDDVGWQHGDYVVWAWWDPATEPQASPVDQAFEIEGTVDRVPAG